MIRLFGQSDYGKEAFSYGSIWIGSMSHQRHTAACRGRTLDLDKLTQSYSPKLLIEPTGRGRDDRDKDPSSPSCGSLSARTESIHNLTEAVPHDLTNPQTRERDNPQSTIPADTALSAIQIECGFGGSWIVDCAWRDVVRGE
jgi:hypothetical protein